VVNAYQSLGRISEWGFVERQKNISAYNMFISANYPSAVDKSGEVPVLNYRQLIVSKGSIPRVKVIENVLGADRLRISYETNLGLPKVSASDEIIALAKLNTGELLIEKQLRGSEDKGSMLIPLTEINADQLECCYVFARSADGKRVSNSVFVELNKETVF
jgi:hypothetical protein